MSGQYHAPDPLCICIYVPFFWPQEHRLFSQYSSKGNISLHFQVCLPKGGCEWAVTCVSDSCPPTFKRSDVSSPSSRMHMGNFHLTKSLSILHSEASGPLGGTC